MLLNPNSIAYRISDASKITSEHLETLFDVILTSHDFAWTYAKISEDNAGPYFRIIEG